MVVICVLYMAEHLVGVQGLIIAVPFAVYVINNLIMKENPSDEQASMVDKAGPAEIALA